MMARRAFSLIEVLMSVFILGIGVIAIASLLPAGISQQRSARDASAGPIVAQSAMAVLRSKYSQSTFGGDDLPSGWSDSISSCQNGSGLLKDFFCHLPPGDFGWTRPARWSALTLSGLTVTNESGGGTVPFAPRGAVHPFVGPPASSAQTGGTDSTWWSNVPPNYLDEQATLDFLDPCFNPYLASGRGFIDNTSSRNIPVNDPDFTGPEFINPSLDILTATNISNLSAAARKPFSWFITREERQWPSDAARPTYYWDCMFRKHNGLVEVAVFVYRIIQDLPGGMVDGPDDGYLYPGPRRPHSVWLSSGDCESGPLFGDNHFLISGQKVVTTIDDLSPFDVSGFNYLDRQWQAPGQLILDEHGGIHRVTRGRSQSSDSQVEFAEPILTPATERDNPSTNFGPDASERAPIRQIWFVPVLERGGRRLEPVYISVEAL
jgi:prepilin-type N-terminal cleavage/methylation domain-containing protein